MSARFSTGNSGLDDSLPTESSFGDSKSIVSIGFAFVNSFFNVLTHNAVAALRSP